MIYVPPFFKQYLDKSPLYFDSLPKILTGVTISNVEVKILRPLERLKIYLMTETANMSSFFKKHKGNLYRQLFKGLGPNYWRTNMGWFTFLITDHYCKKLWKDGFGRKELKTFDFLCISAIVGCASTLTILPFDFIKTQAQLEINVGLPTKRTLTMMSEYIKVGNTSVLYRGWQFRLSQFMISSIVAVTLLEKLEREFKELDS